MILWMGKLIRVLGDHQGHVTTGWVDTASWSAFKFPIGFQVCYSLQIFHLDDFCIFYEIFTRAISVLAQNNPEIARESSVLSVRLKIQLYCLILCYYSAKIGLWFGTVSRNRARKSRKMKIFWFGQKIWLGYPLGYLKIIKLCPNSQNSIFKNFLCVGWGLNSRTEFISANVVQTASL